MDTVKQILLDRPGTGLASSLSGYLISFSEILPDALRFVILIASTVTAISLAYIHVRRALVVRKENKD